MSILLLIYFWMLSSNVNIIKPTNVDLVRWGANFRPLTLKDDAWRLISAIFIHINIFHVIINVIGLLLIGYLLEPILGTYKFILCFLLTGVFANVASIGYFELIITAGASSGLLGLLGVFIAFIASNTFEKKASRNLLSSICLFIVFIFICSLLENGGFDMVAHIGGLVSGLVIGFLLIPGIKNPMNSFKTYFGLLASFLIVCIGSIILFLSIPKDIIVYQNKIDEFYTNEKKALGIYSLTDQYSSSHLLGEIKNNGIPSWKKCITILNEIESLNISDELKQKNHILFEYCDLRLKKYELMYQAIKEKTNIYDQQIRNLYEEIRSILREIEKENLKMQSK